MSNPEVNKGILVSGGSVQAGAIAAGDHARAEGQFHIVSADVEQALRAKKMDDLAEKLKTLEAAIQENGAQMDQDQAKTAATRTERVAQELTKEKPDRSIILDTLQLMMDSLKSATGVMTAVEALKAAVHAVFG